MAGRIEMRYYARMLCLSVLVALVGLLLPDAVVTAEISSVPRVRSREAPAPMNVSTDSSAAARTVERFHEALAAGDSAQALKLLHPTATILESGDIELLAEYRAHHLPADIEFARAVKETRTPTRVTVRGQTAWAVGSSTTRGTFRGRTVNSVGAELVVLTRSADGWRIAAIHWSSHKAGP
jgi:limonene-1,2-epoxide hydrolase